MSYLIRAWVEQWDSNSWKVLPNTTGDPCHYCDEDDDEDEEDAEICPYCAGTEFAPFYVGRQKWLRETLFSRIEGVRDITDSASEALTHAYHACSSHSGIQAISLSDLFAYAWDGEQGTTHWVQEKGFLEYLATGKPYESTPRVDPRRYREVSLQQMHMLVHGLYSVPPEYIPVARVTFAQKVVDLAPPDWRTALNTLQNIPGSKDLRLVFWME